MPINQTDEVDPFAINRKTALIIIKTLTPRQIEILILLARGNNYKQISEILSIHRGTVQTHVYNACRRLGAQTPIQSVAIMARAKMTV